MRPTVEQQIRSRSVEKDDLLNFVNRELLLWARQTRQATNYINRQQASYTTPGDGTFTTIWTSQDVASGTAVRMEARVVARGATDRSAFIADALFYNNGTVTQEGATAAVYVQNAALTGIRFIIVSNHVELQVADAGTESVQWIAVIDAQVVP